MDIKLTKDTLINEEIFPKDIVISFIEQTEKKVKKKIDIKEKKRYIKYKERKDMTKKLIERDNTVEAMMRALEADLEAEDLEYVGESPYRYGVEFRATSANNGESEWLVFEDIEDAENEAVEYWEEVMADDPDSFISESLFEQFAYISDLDKRMFAQEEADNYIGEMRGYEDDSIIYQADMEKEWDYLEENYQLILDTISDVTNENYEESFKISDFFKYIQKEYRVKFDKKVVGFIINELVRDYREVSYDNIDDLYNDIEDKVFESAKELLLDDAEEIAKENYASMIEDQLDDPVQYFIHELGWYSTVSELMELNIIQFDYREASKYIVRSDGDGGESALDRYDGEYEAIEDPVSRKTFYAYGTN